MIRLIYISSIFLLFTCTPKNNNGINTEIEINGNSLINTTYCLLDILEGDPDEGGCWELVSGPSGNTISIPPNDSNPCIDFDSQPCPSEFVFSYSATCACESCLQPAELTICLTCDPPQCNVTITSICN